METSKLFENSILSGCEGIKPGWVRVNFNYFIAEEVFEFIQAAVEWIAEHGWKLLPHYEFFVESGLWKHRRGLPHPPMSLNSISYGSGRMSYASRHSTEPVAALMDYITKADEILKMALNEFKTAEIETEQFPEHFKLLRWFPLPEEAISVLGCD
jgi:hypothetical protein